MQEILNISDRLPVHVLQKAECVIVFPHELKLAFGMGKEYGPGAMTCRTGKKSSGPWGAPAMFAPGGDSIGMQIGGEATDLILLVMNGKSAESILSSKFKLGGDASAAAPSQGPRCFRKHRCVDEGGDPQLFACEGPLCRHFARGLHASPGP